MGYSKSYNAPIVTGWDTLSHTMHPLWLYGILKVIQGTHCDWMGYSKSYKAPIVTGWDTLSHTRHPLWLSRILKVTQCTHCDWLRYSKSYNAPIMTFSDTLNHYRNHGTPTSTLWLIHLHSPLLLTWTSELWFFILFDFNQLLSER